MMGRYSSHHRMEPYSAIVAKEIISKDDPRVASGAILPISPGIHLPGVLYCNGSMGIGMGMDPFVPLSCCSVVGVDPW